MGYIFLIYIHTRKGFVILVYIEIFVNASVIELDGNQYKTAWIKCSGVRT